MEHIQQNLFIIYSYANGSIITN